MEKIFKISKPPPLIRNKYNRAAAEREKILEISKPPPPPELYLH
jgi:hypothetical protein